MIPVYYRDFFIQKVMMLIFISALLSNEQGVEECDATMLNRNTVSRANEKEKNKAPILHRTRAWSCRWDLRCN